LTARRATVSPFGSLAFMLPEASSTRAIDRAVVLQLCTLLWAGGAFAREAGGRDASAKAVAERGSRRNKSEATALTLPRQPTSQQ